MATSSNSEIRALERTLSTLLNKQLQHICATNGLRTGGVKAELQNRIKTGMYWIIVLGTWGEPQEAPETSRKEIRG